jgi:hypothetical protein
MMRLTDGVLQKTEWAPDRAGGRGHATNNWWPGPQRSARNFSKPPFFSAQSLIPGASLQRRIAVSISFGGTKVAVALVDCASPRILVQTRRIEWRILANEAGAIAALIGCATRKLLRSAHLDASDIDCVGIAWPGPGEYSAGEVQATFITGFETRRSIFALLADEFATRLGIASGHIDWRCCPDAAARARGEVLAPTDCWVRDSQFAGLVVNIATGVGGALIRSVGGALIRNGMPARALPELGETCGQWGRFLVYNRASRNWSWRPTRDGSLPELDRATEVRLTELCGGPALAKEFGRRLSGSSARSDPELYRIACEVAASETRNVELELRLLRAITESSKAGGGTAARFVEQAGASIGAARQRLRNSLGLDGNSCRVLLTGGVGENFGRPRDSSMPDLFLAAGGRAFGGAAQWERSAQGLPAELLGAVL